MSRPAASKARRRSADASAVACVRTPEPRRVPGVGVLGDERQHPFALAGDEDRDPAHRRRQQDAVLDLVVLPVERDAFAAKQRRDHRHRLLEPADAVVEREAERAVFRLVPAATETQDQAAAATRGRSSPPSSRARRADGRTLPAPGSRAPPGSSTPRRAARIDDRLVKPELRPDVIAQDEMIDHPE